MLRKPTPQQTEIEMVTLEALVPPDHLLRKIDAVIDFSFIHERVAGLYSADNGRPALDPVVMFKALFVGYLFGVRSERRLVGEVAVNVAYRWFLGLRLTDRVFDASTLSQNRRRRFAGTEVAQDIFDGIVVQAIKHGLVDGTVLYTDSTHLKASANRNRFDRAVVERSRAEYLADLDAAVEAERAAHGQPPLPPREEKPETRTTRVSRTDGESGYMVRKDKPDGFFYLDHRTVDGRLGIITDTFTTPGNVNDATVYLGRLDRQRQRFGLAPWAVGLDAGYATTAIAKGLEDRDIHGVTGYRRPKPPPPGRLAPKDFVWEPAATPEAQADAGPAGAEGFRCPQGQLLPYATTDRAGLRHYRSDPAVCRDCPLRAACIGTAPAARDRGRTVTRHVWQDARDRVDAHRLTAWGKRVYKRRKETVERSFADAKELHGHRYARFRGRARVAAQCLLAAAAQNIKKIALALTATPAPA